ncbi:hypothetical protein DFJ74DRAFT_661791 [Hyaloraphidium curvatum]|nr:hypothetical protein DFJ74DRAFT_661791 [Hyaloraphidium curvatum]
MPNAGVVLEALDADRPLAVVTLEGLAEAADAVAECILWTAERGHVQPAEGALVPAARTKPVAVRGVFNMPGSSPLPWPLRRGGPASSLAGDSKQAPRLHPDIWYQIAQYVDRKVWFQLHMVCREAYDASEMLPPWRTLAFKQAFLSRNLSMLLSLAASPRKFGHQIREVVLDGTVWAAADLCGSHQVEQMRGVFGNVLVAERDHLLPLLPTLLPNVRRLSLLDYSIPDSSLDVLLRSWPRLEVFRCNGHGDFSRSGKAVISVPVMPGDRGFFDGCTPHQRHLRFIDLSGIHLAPHAAGPAADLARDMPALPALRCLDLCGTDAPVELVTALLDKSPGLRCFGYGRTPGQRSPRNRRPSAPDVISRCRGLEVLVLAEIAHDFFPPIQPGQGHLASGLRNLRSLSVRQEGQAHPTWAGEYLSQAAGLATIEWDALAGSGLESLLRTCGHPLRRLVITSSRPRVRHPGDKEPEPRDGDFRAIMSACPLLREVVFDGDVRVDPWRASDLVFRCTDVRVMLAPPSGEDGVQIGLPEDPRMRGQVVLLREEVQPALRLAECAEARGWMEGSVAHR